MGLDNEMYRMANKKQQVKTYKAEFNLDLYRKSTNFALDVVKSNIECYEKRNQSNIVKLIQDITVGKYCEFIVAEVLQTDPPDVEVYGKNKKSFDADLKKGKYNLHVKSCIETMMLQPSWVFQPEDKLTTEPKDNDVIVLCTLTNNIVKFTTHKAKSLLSLYRPPRKAHLKKKVIYGVDLIQP